MHRLVHHIRHRVRHHLTYNRRRTTSIFGAIFLIFIIVFLFSNYFNAAGAACVQDSECTVLECPAYEKAATVCEARKCVLVDSETGKSLSEKQCKLPEEKSEGTEATNETVAETTAGTDIAESESNATDAETTAAATAEETATCVQSKCDCDCYVSGEEPEAKGESCSLDCSDFPSCEVREGRCRYVN